MGQVQPGELYYINLDLMWIKHPGKITEGFYMLGTSSNPMYLLEEGNEYILIEGGVELHRPYIIEQIKSIIPDMSRLKHWFITHSHYDHCGLIESMIEVFPDVKLYASTETIRNLSNNKYTEKVKQLNRMAHKNDEFYGSLKVNLSELKILPFSEFTGKHLKGKDYLIIETPGHSSCSVSIYNISRKILFVSDALGEIISVKEWFPLPFESMRLFIKSIKSLNELKVSYVALGHYGVLEGRDAESAFYFALESCYYMIELAAQSLPEGDEYVCEQINQVFGSNERSFIPEHVYAKSLHQIVNVLKSENFINDLK